MYEFPYGGEQQLNLNWIINEIITLHKRLDPDYELPNFDNAFPYMNLNQLNLDWILRELKAIKDLAPTEDTQLLKMVANALIANTYDAETQYNVDDIVYRDSDNRLYKCITATPAGGEAFDSSKWVEVDVGGVLTDLLNSVVTPPAPYNSNPAMDGTASAGTSTQYARGDHVHPKDTARVPTTRTVNGKALSSNITLNASDIPNDSNVTGDNTDDALNNLNGAITNAEGQITANIQTNLTAIKKYEIGECFVYNGSLYRATQVINNESAINIGTNAAKITLDTAIYDNYAFASLAFVASADVSSSASFDRTGNMITPVGYFSTSTAKSSGAELGTVGITLRKRQLFACIDINTHLTYAVYFNTNGSITAVEGVPQGYFRFIGAIII